ncbi:MAG: ImmA/IrrE family metallo-endopeptidase [Acidobacteriaceae bacterium]|nr:ImmA/IrrE family metallo-endopeptidase [Acidobacteriaceae bacterium]
MKRRNWRAEIVSFTDHLLRSCQPLNFPVDLGKLAKSRAIEGIRFRPMPSDGAIEVTKDGFQVHMCSHKEQSVRLAAVETTKLKPRERFTLAHEIIHTFFYDEQLRPIRPAPSIALLEWLCNYGAARLLLPEFLLERELGPGGRFDSLEMAQDLADSAGVSTSVVVRRLDECRDLKQQDYALMLFEKDESGGIRLLGACLSGVFSTMTKPKLYASPPRWVSRLAPTITSPAIGSARIPHDERWDYVSRVVPMSKMQSRLFVEIRLVLKIKKSPSQSH